MIQMEGNILKMKSSLEEVVQYSLPLGDELLEMNPLIGKKVKITFEGRINDIYNGELIKKSYGQGFSYKSFITLARCDSCIVKPELCHYEEGTCREPKWGEENCLIPHYIYLSVTDQMKVGITRHTQLPTRWIDQGASYALPIAEVSTRKISGLIETEIKSIMSDKTNWRKMLKNEVPEIDLYEERERVFEQFGDLFDEFDALDLDDDLTEIKYPVLEYPEKVTSMSLDKKPIVEGTLMGIKGQYLIFDNGVINMRKHQGYYIKIEAN
ncbi:DUF2797 domain-containing protein [Halobacteriovorax sp. GB3]|nr:DUF2797 domain-containing protein [Halobacteriovorax sp. GB3]MDD0853770.1 DUF2797 domain-containing protein [Halobacteriovorax sp. GB3]